MENNKQNITLATPSQWFKIGDYYNTPMNIAVIGTGYVGLVTGTCLAETGNNVICVDIDIQKVEKLKRGELTIYEPQLDQFFTRNLQQGRLHFTTNLREAVETTQTGHF